MGAIVSNHQPHSCLLNCSFRRKSKKTSKLRVTGLCAGNSPGTGEFPTQMARNAENVSIWWRHHTHGLSIHKDPGVLEYLMSLETHPKLKSCEISFVYNSFLIKTFALCSFQKFKTMWQYEWVSMENEISLDLSWCSRNCQSDLVGKIASMTII